MPNPSRTKSHVMTIILRRHVVLYYTHTVPRTAMAVAKFAKFDVDVYAFIIRLILVTN